MQSFTVGVIWSFGTRIWGLLTGLLVSVIVARALGPEGRGQVALLGLVSSISVMLAYLNLPGSTIYHLNRKKWHLRRLFRPQFVLSSITAILGMLIAIAIYKFWPDQNIRQLPSVAVALVAILIAITIYSNNFGSILSALREFSKLSIISLTTATLAVPGYYIALWHFNGGVVGWAFIGVSVPTVGLIITCLLVLPKVIDSNYSPGYSKSFFMSDCSSIVSWGIISQLGNIAWFLILKSDQFIISGILSIEALGFYAVAAGIAEHLRVIPMTIGQVLFPFAADKEDDERRFFISVCVRLTFWVLIFIGVTLILLSKLIIVFLFGLKFFPAVLPFQILIGAVIALSVGNMLGYEFNSLGRPEVILYCNLLCGVFNIIMNFIVVPRFGLIGAAWVSFLTYTLNSIIILGWAMKARKYKLLDVLIPSKIDYTIIKESVQKVIQRST
jgi:O-antigen/teichoic acid export membrane protein